MVKGRRCVPTVIHGRPGLRKNVLRTPEKRIVVTAITLGVSIRDIATRMNIGNQTARDIFKRYLANRQISRKDGQGRKPKTTRRQDSKIIREVRKDRFISANEIREAADVEHISQETVRRRVKATGEFKSYWATKKPWINEGNRIKRVQWCKRYRNWTPADWMKVLWSDESPFVLVYNKKKKVWRMHNERSNAACTVATVKHDRKINIWGCFGGPGVGFLPNLFFLVVN